jgi:hypothetical protein
VQVVDVEDAFGDFEFGLELVEVGWGGWRRTRRALRPSIQERGG